MNVSEINSAKTTFCFLKASFCSKLFIVRDSRIGYVSYISVALYLFQSTTDCNRCDVSQQKVKYEQTSNPQSTQIFSICPVTQYRNINEAKSNHF